MGLRGSKQRSDPEIPSDDEFDRHGNPKLPPGLEDLGDEPGSPTGTLLKSLSLASGIPVISSLIRSVSKSEMDTSMDGGSALPEKVGAGLLIVSPPLGTGEAEPRRMVLLLKRAAASGNGNTWGLPGGNSDPGETDLWETALREATEEMGEVSESGLHRLATVQTKRGKRQEKHYTVYVVEMSGWEAYRPALNEEHTAWEWVGLRDLLAGNGWGKKKKKLHPVVRIVMEEYGDFLSESLL